jgi:predicted AAA+ superfamily ATPase
MEKRPVSGGFSTTYGYPASMQPRHAEEPLATALSDTPVVLLHGARQVGKTTLARAMAATGHGRKYATLDDGAVLSAALRDPQGFIDAMTGPVTLDEVQRAPELFRAIKASVDRNRRPGRFLLTGSANVMMLPRLSESLAGRIETVPLWPLSQGEIEGTRERFIDRAFDRAVPDWSVSARRPRPLLDRIVRGGFPEPSARADAARRDAWFAAYADATLRREVRELSGAEALTELPRLLAALSTRAGTLLNITDIARSLGMAQSTTRRYITLLEAVFLAVLIPAWSTNRAKRLAKSPKILVADSGLACHLIGADATRLERDGSARGAMLENFVAMELLKQREWSRIRPSLLHFRTATGVEIDLVLEDRAGRLVGIEVKAAKNVGSDDFRGLRALRELAGDRFVRGIVLHDGRETVRFDPGLLSAPISALWSGE